MLCRMRCKENGASINAFPHLLCSSFQLECKVGRTCLPSFQLVPRICCSPESLDSGIVTPKSEQKEKWEYPGCRDPVISGVPSRWQGPFRTANNNNNKKKALLEHSELCRRADVFVSNAAESIAN